MDETTVTHKCPDCGEMLPENFWHAHGSGPLEQSCAIESLKAKLREKELQVDEMRKALERIATKAVPGDVKDIVKQALAHKRNHEARCPKCRSPIGADGARCRVCLGD